MNLEAVERASRHAWPALEEKELEFGVLRYGQGVNRRSNSLSVLPALVSDSAELMRITEDFFAARNLPSIVRILNPGGDFVRRSKSLDQELEACGYELQAPSKLMIMDLEKAQGSNLSEEGSAVQVCNLSQWLQVWQGISGRSEEELKVNEAMLKKLAHPGKFLLHNSEDGQVVSCGMGVLSEQALGLFGIATCESARRKGYGSYLIRQLVEWGLSNGAKYVYLQVESGNSSAVRLYTKLGFSELYSYWYRVKKLN